ncbi:hypothetical protein ZWY2020_008552 [Hordeum vulgare]|nr:hypothetical protein ZWY2020_008552 [Hordeum vulgare]
MAVSQRRIRPRAHAWLQSAPTRHQHHRITYMTTGDGRSSVPVLAAAPSADHAGDHGSVAAPPASTDGVRSGDPDRRRGAPCLSVQPAPHARPVRARRGVYLRRRSWQRRRRRETFQRGVCSLQRERGGAPFSLLAVWHAYSAVRLPARDAQHGGNDGQLPPTP